MLKNFFVENLDIVFFLYGLAFVIMGIAILVQPRKDTIFRLSDIIWLLAGFGLSYGLNEWLDMFAIIKEYQAELFNLIRLAILAISYIFLFEFGRRLTLLSCGKFINKWTTITLCFLVLIFAFILKCERSIWPRYFLGFPGGLLSALGFILYYRSNKTILRPLKVYKYFLVASFSIGTYGILGGIIVPEAHFFPASIINTTSFLELFGIPVQVCRGICSIILAWSIWNILGIFNWEARQKLKNNLEELSEAKFYIENIFKSMMGALIVVDSNAKIKTINQATSDLLGYREDELIGRPIATIFAVAEEEKMLNEIDMPALLISKDFEILKANDAFIRETGVERKNIIGEFCYKITHNREGVCEPPHDVCPVGEVIEKNQPRVEMHTHFDKKGNQILINVVTAPIMDSSGNIIYYLHFTRRVKEGEENERVRKEILDIATGLVNKLGKYAERLEKAYILTKSGLNKLIEMGVVKDIEMYYKAKTGEAIPVSFSGSVMRDRQGKLIGIVCIAHDMRQIKRLMEKEQELTARATEAAEAEHRRAVELEKAYRELKETRDMLIQAEKLNAVGQLASGVAHEVKNPLGIIIQGVNYLETKISPKKKESFEVLSMIKDSVKRADNIIMALLDFSRVTNLVLKPEDINSILGDSLTLVGQRLKFENIKIVDETREGISPVLVDRKLMEQVFINIFLNAIEAMPEGGKIFIRTYEARFEEIKNNVGRRTGDYFALGEKAVIVEIEDTGIGISEENLEKIFNPFFTTKNQRGGAGLGLSVTRNIIDMHKGIIDVKSQPGKGTKVIISLKIAR